MNFKHEILLKMRHSQQICDHVFFMKKTLSMSHTYIIKTSYLLNKRYFILLFFYVSAAMKKENKICMDA